MAALAAAGGWACGAGAGDTQPATQVPIRDSSWRLSRADRSDDTIRADTSTADRGDLDIKNIVAYRKAGDLQLEITFEDNPVPEILGVTIVTDDASAVASADGNQRSLRIHGEEAGSVRLSGSTLFVSFPHDVFPALHRIRLYSYDVSLGDEVRDYMPGGAITAEYAAKRFTELGEP